MLHLRNGGLMVEDASELPDLRGRTLYLDLETTSFDRKKTSLNPWRDCWIAGAAIAVDDSPAHYVPCRHRRGVNLDPEVVERWLRPIVERAEEWVNHNVKYDAHVLREDFQIEARCPLVCTVVRAKLLDSDRQFRGGYGLDALSRDLLSEDISEYELALSPYLRDCKDYGEAPSDVMAAYACQDALTNRRLDRWQRSQLPDDMRRVWETETALTQVLTRMEKRGMRVDPHRLKIQEMAATVALLRIEEELHKIVGFPMRPHVNGDCYEVLCGRYGLPVLKRTEVSDGEDGEDGEEAAGNPSFDKDALQLYLAHPLAPTEVVRLMLSYRKLNTLLSVFVRKFQELHVDGVVHSTYNQCVRTGRMSCRNPNSQQNSEDSKELILPHAGRCLVSADYSQIEYRSIVHYCEDERAIAAYLADPDVDFHQWIAEIAGTTRRAGKTLNFMMGFGGGKEKTVRMLTKNPDVVAEIKARVDAMVASGDLSEERTMEAFDLFARQKAERLYATYHENLPTLKPTSRRAAAVCARRGYVRNLHGRRRHLPPTHAHIAFNFVNQSTAADYMKERMVHLSHELPKWGAELVASVHDEAVIDAPEELAGSVEFVDWLAATMEDVDPPLRVPLRVTVGTSTRHWREASKAAAVRPPKR